jgi:hypothetical protein
MCYCLEVRRKTLSIAGPVPHPESILTPEEVGLQLHQMLRRQGAKREKASCAASAEGSSRLSNCGACYRLNESLMWWLESRQKEVALRNAELSAEAVFLVFLCLFV